MNCLRAIFCPCSTTSAPATSVRKHGSGINRLADPKNTLTFMMKNQTANRGISSRKTEAQELTIKFYEAVISNDVETCEILIDEVETNAVIPGTGYNPLTLAAMRGETEMVKLLKNHSNQSTDPNRAIRFARARGHTEIVKLLSDKPPAEGTLSDDQAELVSIL